MIGQDNDNKHVCFDCIGDPVLAEEVRKNGESIKCSYCEQTHQSIDLDGLADRIHEVVQEQFERSSGEPNWLDSIMMREGMLNDWMPDGERVVDVIAEIAHLPEEVGRRPNRTIIWTLFTIGQSRKVGKTLTIASHTTKYDPQMT